MKKLLLCLILTMNITTVASETTIKSEPTQTKRTPYTGMNDLLFPAAPVKANPYFEQYRFEPIVYIDEKKNEFELFSSIFINPYFPTKHSDFSKTIKYWYTQQQESHNVKFKLIKQSDVEVADLPAKYLLIESKGYSSELEKSDSYRHHVYLLQTDANSLAEIRLSRLKENDKTNSDLWRQWPDFINSIRNIEPYSAGLNTTGRADNTRRYYAHNLSFDVPIGEPGGLFKWKIKQAADRKDTWKTKNGDITLNISLIDDYNFSVKKESADYKQEAEAMEAGGAAYISEITGKDDLEYKMIEIPFGKKNIFYGYIEKTESYSELTLKAAYKTGRAVELKFEAKNEVFEEHKDEIVDWVKNIIILP